jgi:hypothetical protein
MEPNGFEIVPYYMETNNRKETKVKKENQNKMWTQENYDTAIEIWSNGALGIEDDVNLMGTSEIFYDTCGKMDSIFMAIRKVIAEEKEK